MVKNTSICRGKRTSNPNKCKKISSCKVASGKKRTFCRKKHNKTKYIRHICKNTTNK